MQDEDFDNFIRTAARSYNEPPAPDIEGMWAAIDKAQFGEAPPAPATTSAIRIAASVTPIVPPRTAWYTNGWIRVAAALVMGVGLGRATLSPASQVGAASDRAVVASATVGDPSSERVMNSPEANKYIGETIALLASLQSESRDVSRDKQLVSGAADLLNTTRFLLDSPNTNNPDVRGLLEDLELVLAQIVQLSSKGTAGDVEMIHQALEQRDVMPRLRTAVANNYSAE